MKARGSKYAKFGHHWLATLMVAVVVVGALAIGASSAAAGTWMQVSCPASVPASTVAQGWSGFAAGEPALASYTTTKCGEGWPLYATLGKGTTATGSSETLEYQPPAGSTLIGGTLQLQTIGSAHGTGGAYGVVNVYSPTNTGTPIFSCAYLACPASGEGYSGEITLPAGKGGDLYVSASCAGPVGGLCKEATNPVDFANGIVFAANFLLESSATSSASGFAGAAMEPNARGTENLEMTATDAGGPGVYEVTAETEGHVLYTGIPDSNGGGCVAEGTGSGGVLMFHAAQPCKQSEKVSIPLETAKVPDGRHTLTVLVTDAARNTAKVTVGTVTTHNAPENTLLPTILAPSVISPGVPLTSTPGQWMSPAGTDGVSESYQWERCSTTDSECEPIPGATSSAYMSAVGDVGHTLKLVVSGIDADGETVVSSVATSLVAATTDPAVGGVLGSDPPPVAGPGAPNGSPASENARIVLAGPATIRRGAAKAALGVSGRLLTGTGQPIGSAAVEVLVQTAGTSKVTLLENVATTAVGTFDAKMPAGPSRVIEFAYRAFANDSTFAVTAKVTERVRAAIELHITPRHTSSTGIITISGKVLGELPASGVTVVLEVWYLGRWVSFWDPVTGRKGRFKVKYQFDGARGTFPFRVKTLSGQSGFAYTAGRSNTVDVRTG